MNKNKNSGINLDDYQNDVLFIALGGCNKIGKNLYLYCYMGKILIVDFGSGFFQAPGVDIGVPNIDFLIQNRHRIIGIFITHAHEDHIGGLVHLWKYLECTIFTTQFTANFINNKLKEQNSEIKNIKVLNDKQKYTFKPFSVELVALTHSCPDMYGLAIYGPHGILFHTGDWKCDENPGIDHIYDHAKLDKMGKHGVQALLCDSTNTFTKEHSKSEGELQEALLEMISKMKNLVLVTTFASNLSRLKSLLLIAKKLNKKVLFAGRSMFRMILSANQSGYNIDCHDVIIEDSDVASIPRDKLMVISTGCQGELNAALTRIVQGRGVITLKPYDNVIFSSKNIPGNERKIFEVLDKLVRKKINIRTSLDYFVHVSGHPSIKELQNMYDVLKPNCVVPVHGETYHVFKQAKVAKDFGVPNSIAINDGDVLLMRPNHYKVINKVHVGTTVLDGKFLVDIESKVFQYRDILNNTGVVSISVLHDDFKQLKYLNIVSYGVVDMKVNLKLISALRYELDKAIVKLFSLNSSKDKSDLEDMIKTFLKRYFNAKMGKYPLSIVHTINSNFKK